MLSFTLACLPLLFLVFCSRTMGRSSVFALAYLDLAALLEAAGLATTTSLVISLAVLLPAFSRTVRSRCRMLLVPLLVLLPALSAWRHGAFCLLLSAAVLPSFFIPAWRRVCLLAIPSLLLALLFKWMYHLPAAVTLVMALVFMAMGHLLQPIRLSKDAGKE